MKGNMTIKRDMLKITNFARVATGRRLAPVHPGEVLLRDFIEPLEITRYRVAKAMKVPQRRIDEICAGERAVTADTALRLARFFGMDAQIWLNLQAQYDLEVAERRHAKLIEKEVRPLREAA
jgi:addiction module HigA family antidote